MTGREALAIQSVVGLRSYSETVWPLRPSSWGSVVAGDVAPLDREVAETKKGSAQAEVLIILGVEGLAPCRHPAIL